MSKVINIEVYWQTHCNEKYLVIKKDETEHKNPQATIGSLAVDLRDNFIPKEQGARVNIDCFPEFELSIAYGKNPVHNEALSKEEEVELFKSLHN